ncbi:MAG: sugar phosphate isomerase/epimerase [Verrucomicrobiae bacterium]|nr:sugar phosphate isomerase/epimerase [Verrucomicrobiae bacterium]
MNALPRRRFLTQLSLATASLATLHRLSLAATLPRRRFTLDLTPGAIGVSAEPLALLRLAHAHGFESVQPDGAFLARQDQDGLARAIETLQALGLRWGSAGLPVEYRRDEETFRRDLDRLPPVAAALQRAGATRIGTWISPGSNDRPYAENLHLHASRLRAVSRILADHGLRFGLEYVGTPSLRARFQFPFVHNLSQTRELLAAIDVPGTGLILDSWHWWTAGESPEDLAAVRNADVVAVDLNDAPAGIPLAEQQDNRRELPAATGVIPVRGFLRALLTMGYDGPVRAEPFNAPLNQLDNDPACAQTIAALRSAVASVLD